MTTTLDVYSPDLSVDIYDDVFEVAEDWIPVVGEDGEWVTEKIPLVATGTTTTIKTEVRDLNRLLRRAALYVDDESKREYVTLRMTTDTGVLQQSLIRKGSLEKGFAPGVSFDVVGRGNPYTLTIERLCPWEETTPVDPITPGTDVGSYGGVYAFSSIDGDTPARIERVMMSVGGGSYDFTDLWIGIKSAAIDDEGDIADFDPVIEVGSATTIVASTDTTSVGDSTRSKAFYARTSFATVPGNNIRVKTVINYGVEPPGIWQGRYLLLMAARTSSTLVAGLQVRYGYTAMANADYVPLDQIEISGDYWDIYPMGYLQIPPFFPSFDDDNSWPSINLKFGVWAEKISGSGNLEFDDIILLPVEHSAIVNDSDGSPLHVITRKDGRIWSYGGLWQSPYSPGVLSTKNFVLPPRSSVMVLVADQAGYNENLSTEDINIDLFRIYPRWRNYAQ